MSCLAPIAPATGNDPLSVLRLIRSRRVGPATFHRLLAEHGSAAAALDALPRIAEAAGVERYAVCPLSDAQAELRAGERAGARLVTILDPAYPVGLREIDDAPPVLWIKGDPSCLARPLIAVIGARNASSLGLRMAQGLSAGLAAAGVTVVAGLARGIDTIAHQATVRHGTVAVMAGGIDVIYPSENASLAAQICEAGCLLTEQPPGLAPVARHFPSRNRIVAGLSRAVVVVEAAHRSGSLITARMALDQGREVMAVPGHPIDARAAGCNSLIRDGATLVRHAGEVLTPLGLDGDKGASRATAGAADSTRTDMPDGAAATRRVGTTPGTADRARYGVPTRVNLASVAGVSSPPQGALTSGDADAATRGSELGVRLLALLGPSPTDELVLADHLGIPPHHLAEALLALELDGIVERLPGGRLARVG